MSRRMFHGQILIADKDTVTLDLGHGIIPWVGIKNVWISVETLEKTRGVDC